MDTDCETGSFVPFRREQSLDKVRQQLARFGVWMIIASEDESVPALVDAGRKCERMWLETRQRSIAVHPMSQVLEEAPLKDRIARDLGLAGRVQFILRIGYVAVRCVRTKTPAFVG